uniref:BRCT domain-containing protein n=1 Tax=Macrostomum lignano TaxID=282301 RepID=A0A1I8FB09_9PLAT
HQWKPHHELVVEFHAVNSLTLSSSVLCVNNLTNSTASGPRCPQARHVGAPSRGGQSRSGSALDVARWWPTPSADNGEDGTAARAVAVDRPSPAGIRRVGRHQKVRPLLSNFCDSRSLSKSAPSSASMALADSRLADHLAPAGPAKRRAPAFDDSGTFSARLLARLCCSRGPACSTVAKQACRLRRPSAANPRKPRSSTSNLTARGSASARTSLNRLLLKRLSLLSNSTPTPELGECYSVNSAEARLAAAQLRADGFERWQTQPVYDAKRRPLIKNLQQSGQQIRRSCPQPSRVVKPSVASSGEDDDGGDDSGTGSTHARDLVRHPEPYHVRILPAMCYLVWRPNMLRRNASSNGGQRAYLNALQPAPCPCSTSSLRWLPGSTLKCRCWTARGQGQRVQLTDRITDIDHTGGSVRRSGIPVRVFIAGSPGC